MILPLLAKFSRFALNRRAISLPWRHGKTIAVGVAQAQYYANLHICEKLFNLFIPILPRACAQST